MDTKLILLHLAVHSGEVAQMKKLIDENASISAQDGKGNNALHVAAKSGTTKCVEVLLRAKANIMVKNNNGYTALDLAKHNERIDVISALHKLTVWALHDAASHGKFAQMEELIKSGMNVNKQSPTNGDTPLHLAAKTGNKRCINLLLDGKADPKIKNLDSKTPTDLAIKYKRSHCIDILAAAEKGVRLVIPPKPKVEKKPATKIVGVELKAVEPAYGEISVMKNNNQNNNQLKRGIKTRLHISAASGKVKDVQIYIDQQIPINQQDNNGNTPLHMAAQSGATPCMKLLLANKANVNIKNNKNLTAFQVAFNYKRLGCIRLLAPTNKLLNSNNNQNNNQNNSLDYVPNCLSPLTKTALSMSTNNKDVGDQSKEEITKRIEAQQKALHAAGGCGAVQTMQKLIDSKANVLSKDNNGNTALHIACKSGSTACVKFLLDNKADIHIRNRINQTPFDLAYKHKRTGCISLIQEAKLLLKEARTTTTSSSSSSSSSSNNNNNSNNNNSNNNKKNHTPLHSAAGAGNVKTMEKLISLKANVNARDNKMNTPLHLAAKSGNISGIKLLLENKAEPSVVNISSETPMDMAMLTKRIKCIEILKNAINNQTKALKEGKKKLSSYNNNTSLNLNKPSHSIFPQPQHMMMNGFFQEYVPYPHSYVYNQLEYNPRPHRVPDIKTDCVACLNNKRDSVIIRCGHLVLCGSCASNMNECPICRTQFTQKDLLKIFM